MVLKYGEIYVHHNQNEEFFTNHVKRFFGWETFVDESSKIIIKHDSSDTIFDVNEYLSSTSNKSSILVGNQGIIVNVPETITLANGKIAKYCIPTLDASGVYKQNFKEIFANCPKYKTGKPIASGFNCIYREGIKQVFSLVRISSSEDNPIFIFAYESDFMNEANTVYFINWILRGGKVNEN